MHNMHTCSHTHTYRHAGHLRFYNLGASNRGAIRKAPSALSFVYGLRSLNTNNAEDILRSWNSTAPKSDQVTGRKSIVVALLLQLKLELLHKLQGCVSLFGWDACPFTDDSLSSKKLYPGSTFRTSRIPKGSPWFTRGQVTEASFKLFIDLICSQHSAATVRLKLPKSAVEDKAEVCACAVQMAEEMPRSTPNCETQVEEFLVCKATLLLLNCVCMRSSVCSTGFFWNNSRWLQRFAQGDNGAEMEIAAALSEKSETYTLRDNPSFLAGLVCVCACPCESAWHELAGWCDF